jgi:ABC-type branched-subunit amino acid transport system ATPase component
MLAQGRLVVSRLQAAHTDRPANITSRPPWLNLLAGDHAEIVDEVLPRGAMLTRVRRADRFRTPACPVLEIRGLVVKRGPRTVLGLDENGDPIGLNLTLYHGEVIVLQAPNGWGKSTLLAAIAGIIPITAGKILLDGAVLDHLPTFERVRKGLCVLASNENTFPSLRIKEVMQLVGNPEGVAEFPQLADRTYSSLSGGERQNVALSAIPPGLVGIYDEPFSALDMNNTLKAVAIGASDLNRSQLILVPGQA